MLLIFQGLCLVKSSMGFTQRNQSEPNSKFTVLFVNFAYFLIAQFKICNAEVKDKRLGNPQVVRIIISTREMASY